MNVYKIPLYRASLFNSEVSSKKSVKKQIDQTSKKKKVAMAAMKMEDAKFNGDFFSVPTAAIGSQQLDYNHGEFTTSAGLYATLVTAHRNLAR